jgi:uncharacterized membrane protein
MATALALRYGSFAIAALSLVAAYATPLLLSNGEDHPWFLFSYLLLLNVAATELARRRNWRGLEIISFLSTTFIYAAWLFSRGSSESNQLVATLAPLAFSTQRWRTQTPVLFSISQALTTLALAYIWRSDQRTFFLLALPITGTGLVFSQIRKYPVAQFSAFAAFWMSYLISRASQHALLTEFLGISAGFLLFLASTWWHFVIERTAPTTLALAVFALNGVVYYANAYSLLTSSYHSSLGLLAALVAAVYLAFGIYLHRSTQASDSDTRPVLLSLGIAVAFLALAIPIQFTGFTITIAWAMQGAVLAWISYRLPNSRALAASMCLFALVAGRLLYFEAETLPDPQTYSFLWNNRFFTFAASAVALLLTAWWASKSDSRPAALATYIFGNLSLLTGLSLEVLGWTARTTAPENRLSAETIAISILFALYAVVLVSIGVATRSVINRLSGLGLIGLVILKLYLFDVWQLSRPYQISAFVILGILFLATSFLYSHFRRLIENWWKDDKTPT